MNLDEVQSLARALMVEHGVGEWAFAFNRRRRSLGLCYYELRRIELSAPYVVRNGIESIRDTILHEIAHALAGKDAGHGPKWKAIAARIGATPKRCDDQAEMPKGRWFARCPNCGRAFHRFRRPNRRAKYSCVKCGPVRGAINFYIALEGAA